MTIGSSSRGTRKALCLVSLRRVAVTRPRTAFLAVLLLALAACYYLDTPRDFTRHRQDGPDAGPCRPVKNVVFLKVHKCASSTVASILVRRGLYTDHALFGLPKLEPAHLGWPRPLLPKHVLRPHNHKPNIIANHFIYNRTSLDTIMPKNTIYISMIREPFSQFQSVMHYFYEIDQFGLKSTDKTEKIYEFLRNPERYEKKLKMKIMVKDAYMSMTKNLMSAEFGLEEKYMNDTTKISEFINRIDKEFHLVLIYEHFYESLVLLRRILCWRFRDVIVRAVNLKYRYVKIQESQVKDAYRKWSLADHLLYKQLNQTFWRRIRQQGENFTEEVKHLRHVNQVVDHYCTVKKTIRGQIIAKSKFNARLTITVRDCEEMSKRPDEFYQDMVRSNHNWLQTGWIYFYHHFLNFLHMKFF